MTQGKSNGDGDGPRSELHALNAHVHCTSPRTSIRSVSRLSTAGALSVTGSALVCSVFVLCCLAQHTIAALVCVVCHPFFMLCLPGKQNFVILCQTKSRKASHGKVTSCFRVTEVRLQDMADYLMHVTKCQLAMIL